MVIIIFTHIPPVYQLHEYYIVWSYVEHVPLPLLYWTWQLLFFFHFDFIICVSCVLFPSLSSFSFLFKKKKVEAHLLQKRILKLQPNEHCVCGRFNLSSNVNIEPKPYMSAEATICSQFRDMWTRIANKLTYRYRFHNKSTAEYKKREGFSYVIHILYYKWYLGAAKTCDAAVLFCAQVVFILYVLSLAWATTKEKRDEQLSILGEKGNRKRERRKKTKW